MKGMFHVKQIEIDIETYSDVDIKLGTHRYVDSPAFCIQIFAYSIDNKRVKVLDLMQGDTIPKKVLRAIYDPKVIKIAHNAMFERVCIGKHLDDTLDPKNWRCTAVWGRQLGLPSSLEKAGMMVGVEQKDKEGKRLINYFAKPCKPTKVNGGRTQNLPHHAPDDWNLYLSYCGQDVRTEASIYTWLSKYPLPAFEWENYEYDQRIQDRGIPVDVPFINSAVAMKNAYKAESLRKLKELTGVDNPNSIAQLKTWALEEHGYTIVSLAKDKIDDILPFMPPVVQEMTRLYVEAGGSAVAKYDKALMRVCSDLRCHGELQFAGAGTGRWAGRGLQVQNLPRNYLKDMLTPRRHVNKGRSVNGYEGNSGISVLTQLVRTIIRAPYGREFVVSDYSAIEARVVAWLAGEAWVLEVFRTHGMIYEATADRMFHLGGVENVTKDMRQKGKQATLALGYGGGENALVVMGALKGGIKENELAGIVKAWRKANPKIVQFWYRVEKVAKEAIRNPGKALRINALISCKYVLEDKLLRIKLPSGRTINYFDCSLGQRGIEYLNPQTVASDGRRYYTGTWGGKLVENIVQAVARDLLADAIRSIEDEGLETVFHVHDEVIIEANYGKLPLARLNKLMSHNPTWATGLPLNAEGFTTKFYMKD